MDYKYNLSIFGGHSYHKLEAGRIATIWPTFFGSFLVVGLFYYPHLLPRQLQKSALALFITLFYI
jgi:hypothetical protein